MAPEPHYNLAEMFRQMREDFYKRERTRKRRATMRALKALGKKVGAHAPVKVVEEEEA